MVARISSVKRQVRRASACDGKVAFESFQKAEEAAHRQAKRRKDRFQPYRCPHCQRFHVGTTIGTKAHVRIAFDGRQPFAVYAIDEFNRESLVGFSPVDSGGAVADMIRAKGWSVSRIVERQRRPS